MDGGKTIRQLKKEAMVLKIKGYYNMRKSELVEAISKRKMELAKMSHELKNMKIHQLRTFAKKLGLKMSRKTTKIDLVKMISEVFSNWKEGEDENKKPIGVTSTFTPSKFEKKFTSTTTLPSSYNTDKLVGLEVNPNWIHFYWDFKEETKKVLKAHSPVVLRIYDVTYINFNGANANRTFELELDPEIRKYYVQVPNAAADYIAELGYKEGERFVPILRSNLVSTPPSSPRISQMEIWMDLKTQQRFSEISVLKGISHVEKLVGVSSMPPSNKASGGGSFIWMSGRKES